LGIQITWTSNLSQSLELPKKTDRIAKLESKKKDINGVMNTLTEMCLDDNIKSKLIRTKIETLVTI